MKYAINPYPPGKFRRSSLVVAIAAALPVMAAAQEIRELPTAEASAQSEESYLVEDVSSPKLTQPMVNIPKTISVVPESALRDQGATSLGDALRNVAGVSTFGGGEGGGGVVTINDKVSIRGFDARDSIYVDGVRDVAGYSRDMFNYEQVEVIKGSGGSIVGKSAPGGSVNLSSKQARQDDFGSLTASYDEMETVRLTADYNTQLSERVAARINVMRSEGGDRFDNGVENYESTGLAGSLLFSLSASTDLTIDALSMEQDNTPMLGMPFINDVAAGEFVPDEGSPSDPNDPLASGTGGTGLAMGPVPDSLWSNYYGIRGRDFEEVDTRLLGATLNHRVSDAFAIRSQTRWGNNDNESVIGRPLLTSTYSGPDAGRGGPTNYATAQVDLSRLQVNKQENELFITALDGIFTLDSGDIEQDLVIGVEYFQESQDRPVLSSDFTYVDANGNPIEGNPTVDLFNPSQSLGFVGGVTSGNEVNSVEGENLALYVFDTIKLGGHWQLDINGRYDRYEMTGAQFVGGGRGNPGTYTPGLKLESDFFSWGGALSYRFSDNGSIYASYSDANEPPGTNLSFSGGAEDNVDPETSESYEIGGKWQTADQRLLLSAAYFVTVRSVLDDDENGNPFIGGEQEATGFELSAVGALTDNLSLTANYTQLDAEITQSSDVDDIGNGLSAAPDSTASLWGTYQALDNRLTLGLGANYSSGDTYWRRNMPYFETGSYTEVQAMAAYQVTDGMRLQLNVDNLTDEVYVADYSAWGHFLPNDPRTIKLSVNYNF